MSRAIRAILVLLCAWLALPLCAQAKPPAGISIDVQVGYDGWVQPSRVNPVVVEMENNSASLNLSGDLVLVYNSTEYTTRLELPAPSKKRFYLYFPCDNWPPFLLLRVRTKQYTEQFDLNQIYKVMQPTDSSAVVLTQQSGSLGGVNQQAAVRLQRDLYRYSTSELESGKLFVSYFNLDEIDPTPKFFSRADMIVLADIDYQQVTPEFAEALQACASGGGSLVFSLGLNGAGVANSPLAPLCPLAVSGTTQLGNLGDFGRLYRLQQSAPATFAVGRVAPGAEVLYRAGTVPAVIRSIHGSGTVTALAFDFTQAPFKGSQALARIFADSAMQIRSSINVTNWFIHPQYVADKLRQLSEAIPMRPLFVFVFLLVYIALIGPVNFLILSKLKRRTLVWTTIPLIILGFSWFGLETGRFYRGSNNVCAYFQELHLYPDSAYTPYQTVMLIFTAERTNYKLVVPDASAFLYPEIPAVIDDYRFGGGTTGGARMRGLTGSTIDNSKLPTVRTTQGKWTSKEYFYQGYRQSQAKVASQIQAERRDGRIVDATGTYTLDLPFDLYDAYLVGPSGSFMSQGFISGQGEHQVQWGNAAKTGKQLPGDPEDYLVQAIPDLARKQRECSDFGLMYRDELLLVGFTDKVEALAKFDRPHREHLLTMAVVHLPYTPVVPRDGQPSRNIRGIVIGGTGFELRERSWHGEQTDLNKQYTMKNGGYMDVQYEISGTVNDGGRMLLHLAGYELAKWDKLADLSLFMDVSGWNSRQWVGLTVPENQPAMEIPLGGLLNAKRRVTLRFRAKTDFVLEVPPGDAY